MQLTSLIVFSKETLRAGLVFLLILLVSSINISFAESLTYSPDQWPRHWNKLMHKTHLQERLNGYKANNKYTSHAPTRSPVWGVVPTVKQKPRRSVRPEYNTNAHMQNYYSQNRHGGNYYPGFSVYSLATPYTSSLISPYGVPVLAPGLAAPGIPFGTFPYGITSPFIGSVPVMGGLPGTGYMW